MDGGLHQYPGGQSHTQQCTETRRRVQRDAHRAVSKPAVQGHHEEHSEDLEVSPDVGKQEIAPQTKDRCLALPNFRVHSDAASFPQQHGDLEQILGRLAGVEPNVIPALYAVEWVSELPHCEQKHRGADRDQG